MKGRQYIKGKLEFQGEFAFDKKWEGKGFDENGDIIYELINGSGKVKEYEYNILRFEGEYLNGIRFGEGKEYDENDNLIFIGEYIGERNGIGKEYYDTYLEFEGEFKNGERNGKGKEYNKEGKIIFEGEYLNGKRNGRGKEYDSNGNLIFDGEYLNGKK